MAKQADRHELHVEVGRRAFDDPAQLAYLSLVYTTELLRAQVADVIKAFGISGPQYNVLRILMDGPGDGMSSSAISERMFVRSSNIARILPRLLRRELIRREKDRVDTRIVRIRITPAGRRLARQIDKALLPLHARQFAALTRVQLKQLIEQCGLIRGRLNLGEAPSREAPSPETPSPKSPLPRTPSPRTPLPRSDHAV